MGGKSSAPPPPDYSAIAKASEKSAQYSFRLGQEQLAWAREQYAKDSAITGRIVDAFLNAQDINMETAAKDRERYERIFQPLEDQLAKEAADYASPERKNLEMGRAQALVAQQFDQARDASARQLESFGIDPTAVRYAGLDTAMRAQQAATSAAAGNQASQMVDATGRALRSEAINVGRGYPGQIAGQYGTALQAGSGAGNMALAQTGSGANTMGTGMGWTGMGNQALGIWGNTLNKGYQNQLGAYNAENQASSGWGSALGLLGAGLFSKFEEGGPVGSDQTPGGAIPMQASPSGGQAIDDVSAKLTAGEFVVPKDVASWKGEEFFQKLIEQSRKSKEGAQAQPETAIAPVQAPTFVSRPQGALPVG